ncbi:NUDIX hydrolase [Microbacterium sp. CPCC 204701]|uniref:NUDIX hydrolase n=1 Tax=Microbacterium sp. CPCC 204701 TaxID=2493084 RepID=UPI0013E3030F|nr:NUDIX hydrolase [Microbacterium sp. CPCC 204701]
MTDAAGTPTGRTHRRGDPDFPDGLFHLVSAVCVVRADGLVLITRRAVTKDWPLSWEFPAGSALAGETSVDAAVRELREETGLEVPADSLEPVGRVTEESALLDLYVTRVRQATGLVLDPDEVSDAAWVTLAEVHRLCDGGRMAGPWVERLAILGDALARAAGR